MSKADFQIDNLKYTYDLTLCTFNKSKITKLKYDDLNYTEKHKDFNQLDFTIPYINEGVVQIKNKSFDLVKSSHLVLLEKKLNDEIISSEHFTITPNKDYNSGKYTQSVSCEHLAFYIFNNKKLRGYKNKGSQLLWDRNGSNGILNTLLAGLYNTWTVAYMDADLDTIYHTFEFDNATYIEVIEQCKKDFNCNIVFNTINNTISIYSNTNTTNISTNIMFTNKNFIKSLSIRPDKSQIITRLTVKGKNNLTINRYNPLGSYVINLDYFYNEFPNSLKTAWTAYQNKINTLTPNFENLVTQLDDATTTLNTKNSEMFNLNTNLENLQIQMNAEKQKESLVNTSEYDTYYSLAVAKKAEIATKQQEINTVNSNITTINSGIENIRTQLLFENNFTLAQLQELDPYIKDDDLNMETVSDAKILYKYAQQYIIYKSMPPITFSIDSIDLFSQKKFQRKWEKLKCGNSVIIHCPELGYSMVQIKLMTLKHNPVSNSLNLEFSNTEELNNKESQLQKLLINMNKMATNVSVNKADYGQYVADKDTLININDGVDLTKTKIVGDDNVITRRGFLGTNIGGQGVLELTGDKLICSNDNMLTYYTLLSGNGLHLITKDRKHQILIHPEYGFQIDKKVLNSQTNEYEWDNVVYLDTDGQFTIDGGWIKLLTENQKNQILINPSVGLALQKNIGTIATPVWVDILKLDSSGNIMLKNGEGQRIEIDSLGLSSKNDTDELHGMSLKNQGNGNGYDQLGWYLNNDLKCFIAYNQEGNFEIGTVQGQSIYLLTDAWLYLMAKHLQIGEDATTEINMYGNINCNFSKFSNLKNENNQPYLVGNDVTGTFTANDKVITVTNGLITNMTEGNVEMDGVIAMTTNIIINPHPDTCTFTLSNL